MCIYIYIHTCICIYIYIFDMYTCVRDYVYVCRHVCVYVYNYVHLPTYAFVFVSGAHARIPLLQIGRIDAGE